MKFRPPLCISLLSISLLLTSTYAQQPSESEPSLLAKARDLYRGGRLSEAVEAYQAIIAGDPKSGDAYAGMSRVLLKQEKVAEAEAAARKGIDMDAKSDDAHVALGEVDFRKGFIAQSQLDFVEGLKINLKNARAFLGRAKVFRADSNYKHAHDFIDQAYALDPADPDIRRFWLNTLRRPERIAELEKYIASSSEVDVNLEKYLELLKENEKEPDKRCKLITKGDKVSIPLEKFMNGPEQFYSVGLKVLVNGQKTDLQVDTGASGILLSPKMAEKAGVKRLVNSQVGGVGDKGMMDAYFGRADSIKIGDLEFQNCPVEVSERKILPEVEGLIGTDIFDRFLVTLDIPEFKLQLSPLPKRPDAGAGQQSSDTIALTSDSISSDSIPQDRYIASSMAKYSEFYRFGHMILLPTSIGGTSPRLFLVDTGSSITLISQEAAREVTKLAGDEYSSVNGVSGKVNKVFRADKATIQFGHLQQQNQYILAFDWSRLSASVGTDISGALGFSTLGMLKISIDYRDGLINFEMVRKATPLPEGGYEVPK